MVDKPELWFKSPNFIPLTDEEIDEIASLLDDTIIGWSTHEFARAIENEIRAKNGF